MGPSLADLLAPWLLERGYREIPVGARTILSPITNTPESIKDFNRFSKISEGDITIDVLVWSQSASFGVSYGYGKRLEYAYNEDFHVPLADPQYFEKLEGALKLLEKKFKIAKRLEDKMNGYSSR